MINYKEKVNAAMQHLPNSLKPIVEKEFLHYGILEFMQQAKYSRFEIIFLGFSHGVF